MFSCNLIKCKKRLRLFLDRWCRCMIICRRIVCEPDLWRDLIINSLLNTVMNDSWFRASHEATQSTHSTFSTVSSEDLQPTDPINAPLSHIWSSTTGSHCLHFPPFGNPVLDTMFLIPYCLMSEESRTSWESVVWQV